MKINTLYTYCEEVGRRGKDYETKPELHSNDRITYLSVRNNLGKSELFNTILKSGGAIRFWYSG
jgi:hypothetical protein